MRLIYLLSAVFFALGHPFVWGALDTIRPSAPVKDFRFPKFGPNGYTQWVLQGGKGIYESPQQIRVEAMGLRIYTGDERMALELSLDSPEAILRLEENRAESKAPIEIKGSNFEITGLGWAWNGTSKDIKVLTDTRVEFTQSLIETEAVITEDLSPSRTLVTSESLHLKTTETAYAFDFNGGVVAKSGTMELSSERLLARAKTPGSNSKTEGIVSGSLSRLNDLIAKGSVVVQDGARRLKADQAQFFPGTEVLELEGSVQVEVGGSLINGEHILRESGLVTITGSEGGERAQMVLVKAGGLGLSNDASLDTVTLIHADRIEMMETTDKIKFDFTGRVEVFSGSVTLRTEHLEVDSARSSPANSLEITADGPLQVGKVRSLKAVGSVFIEDQGMVATADSAIFYPDREFALLQGSPHLSNEGSVVTGARMELSPLRAKVFGDENRRVRVLLPELPDLGQGDLDTDTSSAVVSSENDTERGALKSPEPTLIISNSLEMNKGEGSQVYEFKEAVEVTATNLVARCDALEVRVVTDSPEGESGVLEQLLVESITAIGNVRVEQKGRISTSNRAIIDPIDEKLILEGSAWVNDSKGQIRGERLILNKGERRAIVEGDGKGKRATVTLPKLSNDND
jgi:lipopolysaccharide export system protein LptA